MDASAKSDTGRIRHSYSVGLENETPKGRYMDYASNSFERPRNEAAAAKAHAYAVTKFDMAPD